MGINEGRKANSLDIVYVLKLEKSPFAYKSTAYSE